MAARPFESRIQDLVYNVDAGIGLRLIKSSLYVLFIGFIILLYTANQFKGLRDAEAMDVAQLGRNVMLTRSFTTQNVRPASIWFQGPRRENPQVAIHGHPDIVHAPLYPLLLGGWFRITGARFDGVPEGPLQVFQPEYRIMFLNHLFTVLTGILVYLLALRLFDRRVALLGVTVFFLSDTVLRNSLSGTGTSVVAFWAMAAVYAMVIAVGRMEESKALRRWIVPALCSLAFCVLAFLTRYAAIALLPGLLLYFWWSLGRRGGVYVMLFVVLFVLAIAPWLARNIRVSGSPLGMTPHLALNESSSFPENSFERHLDPSVSMADMRPVRQKFMTQLAERYNQSLPSLGEGLLISLFWVTFFYRFVRAPVHRLRWGVALSLVLFTLLASFYGEATWRAILMFWPMIILYGLAFFLLLLERLQLQIKLFNASITTAVVVLSALPMIFALMPPRQTPPYPPYSPELIGYISKLLEPNELMCTDMPWATAWYGGRTSVLLPRTVDQFYDINDYMHRFHGLYFTTITRNKPFIRTLRSPLYLSWFPILEGRLPSDFPLSQGIPLRNMEQIFLSDRARWAER